MRAKARRVLKEAGRTSRMQYVSTISASTSLSIAWNKIRNIAGKSMPISLPILKIDDSLVSDIDVANILAKSMAEISSGASHSKRFASFKIEQERKPS